MYEKTLIFGYLTVAWLRHVIEVDRKVVISKLLSEVEKLRLHFFAQYAITLAGSNSGQVVVDLRKPPTS